MIPRPVPRRAPRCFRIPNGVESRSLADHLKNLDRVGAALRSARDGIARERVRPSQRRRQETEQATKERARQPWRGAEPSEALTWGELLGGDAFVAMAAEHGGFGQERSILEIGPGYGRLVKAALGAGLPFRRWTGVDLSASNVAYLSKEVGDTRVRFVEGDAESVALEGQFDTMLSSLTLKHLYPTFEVALGNVARHMAPGGLLFFDLVEAKLLDRILSVDAYFRQETTYIRRYAQGEVRDILGRCGLALVTFDEVEHAPGRRRLLVMARAAA